MIVTRHAPAFFKLQLGDLTVAVNPPSKESKMKASRFGADIVLENLRDPDFSGGKDMNLGGKAPFVISGPGEYEVKSIFIKGAPGEFMIGGEKAINTIYTFSIDVIRVCFLGLQSNKTLVAEAKSGLSDIDLLFIGFGQGIIPASDAYKLAVSLEPKAIVPFSFKEEEIKAFLKEGGSNAKAEEKLTLKRKDLEGKDGDIMILSIT